MLRQCMLQAPEGIWSHHSEGFTCLHSATGVLVQSFICRRQTLIAFNTALSNQLNYHATIPVSMRAPGPAAQEQS